MQNHVLIQQFLYMLKYHYRMSIKLVQVQLPRINVMMVMSFSVLRQELVIKRVNGLASFPIVVSNKDCIIMKHEKHGTIQTQYHCIQYDLQSQQDSFLLCLRITFFLCLRITFLLFIFVFENKINSLYECFHFMNAQL